MAIIGEKLKDYVITQINQRQRAHGTGFESPEAIFSNRNRPETDIVLLNANNSWIKLASGVKVTKEKLKALGYNEDLAILFEGKKLAEANVLFGGLSTYSNGILTQATEFLGEAYQASGPWGIVPMPGIESIEIKSLTRGSLKKATVKLVAQNRDQLAILDVLYLRLGYSVLLEWGNSFYKKFNSTKVDDPNTAEDERTTIEQMGQTLIDNKDKFFSTAFDNSSYLEILPEVEALRAKHQGNYDALLGKISNFNWSFNNDGSYNIEITIISLGDVVESLKSNVIASHDTLSYVNSNSLGYTNESSTLDKARKDNIILSLLHVFRLQNLTFQDPTNITIKTKQIDPPVDQPVSNLGNLLQTGPVIISSSTWTLKITAKVGIYSKQKGDFLPVGGVFIPDLWFSNLIKQFSTKQPNIPLTNKLKPWKQGFGWFPASDETTSLSAVAISLLFLSVFVANPVFGATAASAAAINSISISGNTSVLELKEKKTHYDIVTEKNFSQSEYESYKATNSGPIKVFLDEFETNYKAAAEDTTFNFTDNNGANYQIKNLFLFPNKENNIHPLSSQGPEYADRQLIIKKSDISHTLTATATTQVPNPLTTTGYKIEDAFILKLDTPEYYIRFGYLLSLFSQKVITRIDKSKSNHDENPNLFQVNNISGSMTCLPNQMSFDWRKCIVARKVDEGYEREIFPELLQWPLGSSQVANAMNIYLNFEFIAESLTSNLDEKGNVSVYNCIKSLCDGINIALGGVNNLEPIIDEDTNTLNILDSTPNEIVQPSGGYELKLYGYSKDNANNNTSTFVRKVDLKTAITPEYATMVTVGATAGGYVKGIEATAFSRWNDGILDRFKEKLIAADKDIATTNSSNENADTVASFEQAMYWTARCFGIDGGKLWDLFP